MKRLTLIDKAFVLKSSQLFSQLDLDLLLAIADKLSSFTCDAGDLIFEVGEQAHRIYFLVRGSVEMCNEQGNVIATLNSQDFFGEESLFNEQPRAYSARCQKEALLLTLSHTHLMTIISECPQVAIGLLQAYASTTPFRPRKG